LPTRRSSDLADASGLVRNALDARSAQGGTGRGSSAERSRTKPKEPRVQYAILSDIHGNLEALEAVLASARAQGAEQIVCLGDVVGHGPQPVECLQLLLKANATIVAGNHDFAVADRIDISNFNVFAREATLWTREQLGDEER